MLHTKEFYDIMEYFEAIAKKMIRTGNQGLVRSDKKYWAGQIYYNDGTANEAFKLFLSGYAFGKTTHQQ